MEWVGRLLENNSYMLVPVYFCKRTNEDYTERARNRASTVYKSTVHNEPDSFKNDSSPGSTPPKSECGIPRYLRKADAPMNPQDALHQPLGI